MNLIVKRDISETCPWGYGLVRHSWIDRSIILAPIPLNFILRGAYHLYIWCVARPMAKWERMLIESNTMGREEGRREIMHQVLQCQSPGDMSRLFNRWREELEKP